jgi:hypothetical protein
MVDSYEFAANMFGYVPDWLPAMIGKVVMVAALVEGKVDGLLMNLDSGFQNIHAGKPVMSNIRTCRSRLEYIGERFPQLVATIQPLLVDVEVVLHRRNALVHSLWPDNNDEVARGWRNLPPNQRDEAVEGSEARWTEWTEIGRHDCTDLLRTLEKLVDRLVEAIAASGSVNAPPL